MPVNSRCGKYEAKSKWRTGKILLFVHNYANLFIVINATDTILCSSLRLMTKKAHVKLSQIGLVVSEKKLNRQTDKRSILWYRLALYTRLKCVESRNSMYKRIRSYLGLNSRTRKYGAKSRTEKIQIVTHNYANYSCDRPHFI